MFRYFVVTRLFSPRFLLVCLFVLSYRKGVWLSSCFDIRFQSTGANSPRSISLVSSVQYNPEIPCSDATTASSKLKAQLESSVSCAVNGSCSINVSTPGIYLFLIKLSILFDDAFFYSLFCWNFMTQKSCFGVFLSQVVRSLEDAEGLLHLHKPSLSLKRLYRGIILIWKLSMTHKMVILLKVPIY